MADEYWYYPRQIAQIKRKVQLASLKTIAAFLSSEGGILLIGIKDNGEIFGLDADYALLSKRPNWDGFSQKLISLIISQIGTVPMPYIKIDSHNIDDKTIAVVRVSKSPSPIFLRHKDQKYFFICADNTTRALDVEETHNYLREKMKTKTTMMG